MEKKHFILHGKNANVKVYIDSLEELIQQMFEADTNPEFISLPGEWKIRWNPYMAHYTFAKGRISEKEFIEMLKTEEAA